jgi:hypothetical protein
VDSTGIRYLVTFSAVIVGIGWAAWDFLAVAPTLPAPHADAARQASPELDRVIFDACVTFYGCVYGVGKAGYRFLGRHGEAEELRRWSRWHMWLLNALGGAWLCSSAWESFRGFGLIRPAVVVGAGLFVSSVVSTLLTTSRGTRGGPADNMARREPP